MQENINSGYGQFFGQSASGKVFVIASATEGNYGNLQGRFKPDSEGIVRLHNTWASAIAATVAGRGDKILVSQGFATAPTLAQIATMSTNGVVAEQLGGRQGASYATHRPTGGIASGLTPLFTITGKVKILDIVGEVTTVIETATAAVKLVANPTVGADVDICATNDLTADAVGTFYTITGTFANAMVATTSGAAVAQAAPTVVAAGSLDMSSGAAVTGSIKWTVRWEPIDPGARVIAV